jgi:hypothetical protein
MAEERKRRKEGRKEGGKKKGRREEVSKEEIKEGGKGGGRGGRERTREMMSEINFRENYVIRMTSERDAVKEKIPGMMSERNNVGGMVGAREVFTRGWCVREMAMVAERQLQG